MVNIGNRSLHRPHAVLLGRIRFFMSCLGLVLLFTYSGLATGPVVEPADVPPVSTVDTTGVQPDASGPFPPGFSDRWPADSTYPAYQFRPIDNLAFGVGETLKFAIGWEKIVAGHAEVTVPEIIEYQGRTCFRARSTAHSTSFFSTFFRVEDWAESIIDVREIIPLRFEKQLREGKYESDQTADFYPEYGVACTKSDTVAVPPYVQDALSLLYYVRTRTLNVGDTLTVDNFSKNKSYPLVVRVVKRERVQVKAGTFNTIVVEPLLQAAGLFKHKGQLKVWLTDDRLKMPVLMKSKVIVGSIIAELEGYTLGRLARY